MTKRRKRIINLLKDALGKPTVYGNKTLEWDLKHITVTLKYEKDLLPRAFVVVKPIACSRIHSKEDDIRKVINNMLDTAIKHYQELMGSLAEINASIKASIDLNPYLKEKE